MARAPRLAVAAAIVAVAAVLALRVNDAATRTHWTHDSVISALAATAHQADYAGTVTAGAPPVGETVEAARWQRFLRVEARGAFARIAADLRRHDTHPPLYFWMLHMAFMAFGAGIGVALALNAVLYALAAATVAMAGWVAFRAALPAAAIVALWAALPPLVHPIALMARQYDLLALLGAAGALALAGHMRGHRRWPLALGAAAAGLGLLTHHAAALFLVSTALALGCRLGAEGGRRRTAAWLAALAAMFMVAVLWGALAGPADRGAAALLLPGQLLDLQEVLGGTLPEMLRLPVLALLSLAVLGGLGAGGLRSRNPALLIVLTHLVLYAAAYATGLVPGHATSARYLVFLLPFTALGTVAALRPALSEARLARIAALVAGLCFALAVSAHLRAAASPPPTSVPVDLVAEAGTLVMGDLRRGYLLVAVAAMAPGAGVLAAPQDTLIARAADWAPRLRPGDVLIETGPATGPGPHHGALSRAAAAHVALRPHSTGAVTAFVVTGPAK